MLEHALCTPMDPIGLQIGPNREIEPAQPDPPLSNSRLALGIPTLVRATELTARVKTRHVRAPLLLPSYYYNSITYTEARKGRTER